MTQAAHLTELLEPRWVESLPGVLFVVDAQSRIAFASLGAAAYVGLDEAALLNTDWRTFVHDDDRPGLSPSADSDQGGHGDHRGGNDVQVRLRAADGTYRWHAIWISSAGQAEGQPYCLVYAISVDDAHRTEDELRWSQERIRFAEAASDVGIWEWDVTTGGLLWSEGMEKVYEMQPGTFGGTFDDYIAAVHPDDREKVVASTQRFVETGELENEHRILSPDGSVRWLIGRGQLLRNRKGEVVRAIGVGIDVTHQRQTEDQLRSALATRDEFLGLLSHEIKNPLTSIVGMSSILRRWGDRLDESTRSDTLEQLTHDSERLLEIIENMLVLARLDAEQIETEPVLVQRIIARYVRLLRRNYPDREVETHIQGEVPPAIAHGMYVDQVLRNLVSNALKYSPADQPVRIEVTSEDDGVVIRVSDRGPGLGVESERVFNRPFRAMATADLAPGMGIGLTVCRRLTEVQGGRIWSNPREGGGTEMAFWLPVATADE